MSKIDVSNADLAQALDWRPDKTLYDLVRNPLTVCLRVGCPNLCSERCNHRQKVDWALSVLESNRLPYQTPPPEEQEHVATKY